MHKIQIHVAAISMGKPNCVRIQHVQALCQWPLASTFFVRETFVSNEKSNKNHSGCISLEQVISFFRIQWVTISWWWIYWTPQRPKRKLSQFSAAIPSYSIALRIRRFWSDQTSGSSSVAEQILSDEHWTRLYTGLQLQSSHHHHSTDKSWQRSIWWLRRICSVVPSASNRNASHSPIISHQQHLWLWHLCTRRRRQSHTV